MLFVVNQSLLLRRKINLLSNGAPKFFLPIIRFYMLQWVANPGEAQVKPRLQQEASLLSRVGFEWPVF